MKILFISLLFPPVVSGGYEIECRQVADLLVSYGHDVAILTSDHRSTGVMEIVPYPVMRTLKMLLPLDQPVKSTMRLARMMTRRFNKARTLETIHSYQPDMVYLWSLLRIGMGPVRAVEETKIPYAWRIGDEFLAGYIPPRFTLSPRGLYRYICDGWFFRESTFAGLDFQFVSSITRSVNNNLVHKGVPLECAKIIPKGIPLDQFFAKEPLGQLSNPVRILYTGRLHPEKGVHTLLSAIRLLSEEGNIPPLSVTIVGTGADYYLTALSHQAQGIQTQINFTGHVDYQDLGPIYRDHDIFVCPSIISEGLGSALQEAMASGLAIASTGHGGQGEFLADGENALLFPAGDSKILCHQLRRLIQDHQLRKKIATEARNTAQTCFSMDTYGKSTDRFLQEAWTAAKNHRQTS